MTFTAGCASIDVYPVENGTGSVGKTVGKAESGIRFYRPAPHVWITRAVPSDKVNIQTNGTEDKTTKDTTKTSSKTDSTVTDGYQSSIVMLPDYSREYIVEWHVGLGNVNPNFALAEGWNLTLFNSTVTSSASSLVDSTIGKAITAYGGVAAARIGAESITKNGNFKGPGLYKLDVAKDGTYSLGALVFLLQ
jgi:hypothetical protein